MSKESKESKTSQERKLTLQELGITVELEMISPEDAIAALSAVPEFQRKVAKTHVEKIAKAVRTDNWKFNGATIVYDKLGNLIDGQHRLQAIAISAKTVPSLVVRGIDTDIKVFETIDDAKARRVQDFLHVKNGATVGGVARLYHQLLHKQWPPVNLAGGGAKFAIPTVELVELVKPHLEYLSNLSAEFYAAGRFLNQPSFVTFLAFYFGRIYTVEHLEQKVAEFFAKCADGANLDSNDPAFALRKRYFTYKSENVEITRTAKQALILKALNHYLDDNKIQMVRWESGREPFPVLRGYKEN